MMDQYQQFIHKSRYARWLDSEGRRERWDETVLRYVDFWREREQLKAGDAKLVLPDIKAAVCVPFPFT